MLNSKQRATLRSKANGMETILQVGKIGIGDTLIKQVGDALKARELIKMRVLENSMSTAREAANEIAKATDSEVVQVIGTKFVLYKRNDEKPIYDLVADARRRT